MGKLDTYILRQAFMAFALFALILGGLIWLTQAVRLIDTVLSSGQSLWQLVNFSLLVLPKVLSMVVPVAGFAAAIYTLNKLYTEAELVVMMMAGQGPFALARPLVVFGLAIGTATLLITNLVAPWGARELAANRAEIRSEIANSLIREGRFLHPVDGLTIFIRETSTDGRMSGLFLHDERDPATPVTYTATEAVLARDDEIARLVMRDGAALTWSAADKVLARVQFQSFSYDLSELIATGGGDPLDPDILSTSDLFDPPVWMRAAPGFEPAAMLAEGIERIVLALDALLLPLVALAAMLSGGYQRRGFSARIFAAIGGGLALVAGGVLGKSAILANPAIWAVNFVPALAASLACFYLLWRSTRPASPVRKAAA